MIRPSLSTALAAALALICAACASPVPVAPTGSPSPSAPWGPTPPLEWSEVGDGVEAFVGIDAGARRYPVLHAALLAEVSADLIAWRGEMRTARADFRGPRDVPWTAQIVYDETVETERLFGLWGLRWSFEGGAHGNGAAITALWDKRAGALVAPRDLLRADADAKVLDAALCRHLNAVRSARYTEMGETPPAPLPLPGATSGEGIVWSCPHALDTAFLPAVGDQPGRAGGLGFHIDPYVAGPYVDGSFEVIVPQAEIRAQLSPAWADQFAGTPVPAQPRRD